MSDLAHWFGNDLTVAASGDLLSIDPPALTEQRLLRRLLTAPGSYIWHPTYGAGLAQYIGRPTAAKTIKAIVRQQLAGERAVASSPAPQITVTSYPTGALIVTIEYWNTTTGSPRTMSFNVT